MTGALVGGRFAELDETSCITEARILARLSVQDCIDLCDISWRTWYRWHDIGAPRWAVRLVMSQRGTLDRFGWPHWEIRSEALHCNQLHHRYYWTPVKLLLPLYGIQESDIPWQDQAANLASLEGARRARNRRSGPVSTDSAASGVLSTTAHNI